MSIKKLKPLKDIEKLTEDEWLREFTFIENEVIHTVDIFNFLEEINRLGAESEAAFDAFSTVPLFWNVVRDCLQESLFMGLGRLCDAGKDVINVHRVLNAAVIHPEFFKEQALRRRIKARNVADKFADGIVLSMWVPKNTSDWKYLTTAVNFHMSRIENIYRPIRNSHYGHRLTHTDIAAMFRKTNRKELSETLDALHELVLRLRSLCDNGNKPELGVGSLEHKNQKTKGYVQKVVGRLARKKLTKN